jgi:phosphonate transport system substrate-binding protein
MKARALRLRADRALVAAVVTMVLALAACGEDSEEQSGSDATTRPTLKVGAIPDQDPQELARLYGTVADYLARALDVKVEYEPVADYTAAVTAFRVGDLDLVWFGGLTSVQAQKQVEGAEPVAQRDIDAAFHSVFIANRDSGIRRFQSARGLAALAGRTFTFGSESSTSGRLMPQYFLQRAGVGLGDLKGKPGFSGSHDKTIDLVQAGTYDAGVLNEQVWLDRLAKGDVDRRKVGVIWRSPPYPDYQWVIRPDADRRFGDGFTGRVKDALLSLRKDDPRQRRILDLFGADRFIPTKPGDHRLTEQAGEATGLLR